LERDCLMKWLLQIFYQYLYIWILITITRYYEGKKYLIRWLRRNYSKWDYLFNIDLNYPIVLLLAKKLLSEMREKGIYTSAKNMFLINLAPNFNRREKVIRWNDKFGNTPSCKEYGTLINISSDFKEGKKLFDEMIVKYTTYQ